jgi:hypothetical protein
LQQVTSRLNGKGTTRGHNVGALAKSSGSVFEGRAGMRATFGSNIA